MILSLFGFAKKSIFLFLAFLLFTQLVKAQEKDLDSTIKNESHLQLQPKDDPEHRIDDVWGATYCNGMVDTCLDSLLSIGISANSLKIARKVHCTAGAFDGNGYMDFAIWGTLKRGKNGQFQARKYFVFFYEKSKLIHCIRLVTPPGFLLLHYPPRLKVGPNGEPISKNDALWVPGETDGYDDTSKGTVYIFDNKTGNFKAVEFGKK